MENSSKKVFIWVLSLVFLFLVYFLLLPKIFNLGRYTQQIKAETEKTFKFPLKIGAVDSHLTWNLGVKVDIENIFIRHKNNTHFLTTGHVSLEISIPELFRDKIKIRKMEVKDLNCSAKRLKNGHYDIEELFGNNKKIIIKNTCITAKNYRILAQNEFISPPQRYLIKGKRLDISGFTPKKHIHLKTNGTISKQNLTTDFALNFKKQNDTLILNEFEIKAPTMDVDIKGKIAKLSLKNPIIDLKLLVKNSKIDDISNFFPDDFKMPYDLFLHFKKCHVKGNVNANLLIKGGSKSPDLFGNLDFNDFVVKRNNKTVYDGVVKFTIVGQTYNVDADVLSAPGQHLYVKGDVTPKYRKISLGINANNIELGPSQELLFALRDLFKFKLGYFMNNITLDGKGSGSIYVHGDTWKPSLDGYLRFADCKLNYIGLSQPWEHGFGKIRLKGRDMYFEHIKAYTVKSPVFIDGDIIKEAVNLIFTSNKLNATEIRKLIYESRDLRPTKELILSMQAIKGYAKAQLRFGGNVNRYLVFKDFTIDIIGGDITYKEVGFPVELFKGRVYINKKGTFSNGVQARILGAPAQIKGQMTVKNKLLLPNFNVKMKNFQTSKIVHFKASPLIPNEQKQIIDQFKNFGGNFDADMTFLLQDCIAKVQFHNTSAVYSPLNLPFELKSGNLAASSSGIAFDALAGQIRGFDVFSTGVIKDKIFIENLSLFKNNSPLMIAHGNIKKINKPAFENFIVEIPESISITELNPIIAPQDSGQLFKKGLFSGKANINGDFSSPKIVGGFLLQNVVPSFANIVINSARLQFNPDKAYLCSDNTNIGSTKIKFALNSDNFLGFPLKINTAGVYCPKLDCNSIINDLKIDKTALASIPFSVENGVLNVDELFWNKITVKDFSSSFNIIEGACSLPEFQCGLAGGTAGGKFCYKPGCSEIKGHLNIKEITANSLFPVFNLSDKISGTINGSADFSTKGNSVEEIIQNAEAKADFSIEKGHSDELGKINYFLMAQNTMFAGLGNLTMNKIINLFAPQKLGDFKALKGSVSVQNGEVVADKFKFEGGNLNLSIKGNMKMKDQKGTVNVLGELSNDGRIGKAGNISLNSIISQIPLLGFIPGKNKTEGLFDKIPFIERVPLVNGIGAKKSCCRYQKFIVKILKDMKNNNSTHEFEWVNKLSVK